MISEVPSAFKDLELKGVAMKTLRITNNFIVWDLKDNFGNQIARYAKRIVREEKQNGN